MNESAIKDRLNIAFHDPRHRNKSLARILMEYRLMDRAGMGILRMGVKSLAYGRRFPAFKDINNSIHVTMDAEYIRPGIFVLTRERQQLYIPDLILLIALYERGYLSVMEAMELIKKVTPDGWSALADFIKRWQQFVELCGSKEDIFIRVVKTAKDLFELQKYLAVPSNSEKYVLLFKMLKSHKSATNEDVLFLLKFSHSSTTSRFLGEIKWLERTGKGASSKWRLSQQFYVIN